jgi:hypothetical protein
MRLAQGELTLFDVAGAVHKIHFTVDTTLYLREAGYKEGGHGESKLSGEPQSQFLDTRTVTDPGLCDNLSTFQWAGGPSGRGIFEYALGRHERYQPGRTA